MKNISIIFIISSIAICNSIFAGQHLKDICKETLDNVNENKIKITLDMDESYHLGLNAPLSSIGKITRMKNPKEKAICTAVMIEPRIIIVPTSCAPPNYKTKYYFWPGSNEQNLAPFGGVKIKFFEPLNKDITIAILDKWLDNIACFDWWVTRKKFHKSWKDTGVWALAGYVENSTSPKIIIGCKVIDSEETIFEDKYEITWGMPSRLNAKGLQGTLNISCPVNDTHYEDFINGAVLFANICGIWSVVGIKIEEEVIQLKTIIRSLTNIYLHGATIGTKMNEYCQCNKAPLLGDITINFGD